MSICIVGDFRSRENLKDALNSTFGTIGKNPIKKSQKTKTVAELPEYSKRIKLRHVFLTDVSADKAGPKPATLIPTTHFLDPATYIFPAPKDVDLNARFNALGFALAKKIEEEAQKIEKTTKIKFIPKSKEIPFARIVALNVEKTGEIDKLFLQTSKNLSDELEKIVLDEVEFESISGTRLVDLEKNALLSEIESEWLVHSFENSATAEEICALVTAGANEGIADRYLLDYAAVDSAGAADYISILSEFFSKLPPVRIYSADSKK